MIDNFLAQNRPDKSFVIDFMIDADPSEWRIFASQRKNLPASSSGSISAAKFQADGGGKRLAVEQICGTANHSLKTFSKQPPGCSKNEQKQYMKEVAKELTAEEKEDRRKSQNREYQRRFRERRLLRIQQSQIHKSTF
jgi:hypothetical protein